MAETPTINKLLTGAGALIALIPGLSQLKKIDLLPHYWDSGNLVAGVMTSALCMLMVLVFYIYRKELNHAQRAKIVRRAISIFVIFIFSTTALLLLRSYCIFRDTDNKEAFIPVVLSDSLNHKIADPAFQSREKWVIIDHAPDVNQEIQDWQNGEIALNLTMGLFLLIYLLVFISLITPFLILGFHVAPEMSMADNTKDSGKKGPKDGEDQSPADKPHTGEDADQTKDE